MSVNITFKPGAHDGEINDNPLRFPAGLVYLAIQAEASDGGGYSGYVTGWVRPEVARLVKAAPELLEIAKEHAASCPSCNGTGQRMHSFDRHMVDCEKCRDTRAAIAKAGEA